MLPRICAAGRLAVFFCQLRTYGFQHQLDAILQLAEVVLGVNDASRRWVVHASTAWRVVKARHTRRFGGSVGTGTGRGCSQPASWQWHPRHLQVLGPWGGLMLQHMLQGHASWLPNGAARQLRLYVCWCYAIFLGSCLEAARLQRLLVLQYHLEERRAGDRTRRGIRPSARVCRVPWARH